MAMITINVDGWLFAIGDCGPKRAKGHSPALPFSKNQNGVKLRTSVGDLFIPLDHEACRKLVAKGDDGSLMAFGNDIKARITIEIDEIKEHQRGLFSAEVK